MTATLLLDVGQIVPGWLIAVSPLLVQLIGFLALMWGVELGVGRRKRQRAAAKAYARPTPLPPPEVSPALADALLFEDANPLPAFASAATSGAVRFEVLGGSRPELRLRAVLLEPALLDRPTEAWASEAFAELRPGEASPMDKPYVRHFHVAQRQMRNIAMRELWGRKLKRRSFHLRKFLLALVGLALYACSFYLAGFAGLEIPDWVMGITWFVGGMFVLLGGVFQLAGPEKFTTAGERALVGVHGVGLEVDRILRGGLCDRTTAERLLPWACVFRREDEWMELLRRLEASNGYRPEWLVGTPDPADGKDKYSAFVKLAKELSEDTD